MPAQLDLGPLSVDLVFKDIKNIHLSVHPPTGRIRIAAPERMGIDKIRVFAISKLEWIKRHQAGFRGQERESPREYIDRESHYLWAKRYLLKVVESDAPRGVELAHRTMLLHVRPSTTRDERKAVIGLFYRDQLRSAVPSLLEKWQPLAGVSVDKVYVRHMKTKWGSCNPGTRSIRLNTELAKKPEHCLEYVIVHELVHMLEPRHGENFVRLMNGLIPEWRHHRDELNWHPLAHEEWDRKKPLDRPVR
jgi:predicted metal-dependent hydrolase